MSRRYDNATLEAAGWVRQPDGSYSKRAPAPRVGPVERAGAERAPVAPLDRPDAVRAPGAPGLEYRVTMVMLRRRLLDRDAVAYAMKPLTDAVARNLGLDDNDPRIEWEYAQQQTRGEPGVLVKIERLKAGDKQ